MRKLSVFTNEGQTPEAVFTGFAAIAQRLAAIGIRFERLPQPGAGPDREAGQDEVIEAWRQPLDRLMHRFGFAGVDAVTLRPDASEDTPPPRGLTREHWHRSAEGCLFESGRGALCLRMRNRIHRLCCRRGDFVVLPAGTRHWLEAGSPPDLRVVRLFAAADDDSAEANFVRHRT